VIWSEWKRINPKETMKVFEERKDSGFETLVGVDKLMEEEVISNDEYDDDAPENNWQAIVAAQARRNIVQNLIEVGRIVLDATTAAVGRIVNSTANATTTTAMTLSNESMSRAQFRRLKTLSCELKALKITQPTEETEVVASK